MGSTGSADYRKLLYKILHYALVEIRSLTEEKSPGRKIYAISSLVHNFPMVLMKEDGSSDANYEAAYCIHSMMAEEPHPSLLGQRSGA